MEVNNQISVCVNSYLTDHREGDKVVSLLIEEIGDDGELFCIDNDGKEYTIRNQDKHNIYWVG